MIEDALHCVRPHECRSPYSCATIGKCADILTPKEDSLAFGYGNNDGRHGPRRDIKPQERKRHA